MLRVQLRSPRPIRTGDLSWAHPTPRLSTHPLKIRLPGLVHREPPQKLAPYESRNQPKEPQNHSFDKVGLRPDFAERRVGQGLGRAQNAKAGSALREWPTLLIPQRGNGYRREWETNSKAGIWRRLIDRTTLKSIY